MDPLRHSALTTTLLHAAKSLSNQADDRRAGTRELPDMFGKRSLQDERQIQSLSETAMAGQSTIRTDGSLLAGAGSTARASAAHLISARPLPVQEATPRAQTSRKTDDYYELKTQVFAALIVAIDVTQLGQM